MSGSKLYAIELGWDTDVATAYRIVRCMECTYARKNPLVGCGYICECFDSPLPDQDGFCAWGETEEDASNDSAD